MELVLFLPYMQVLLFLKEKGIFCFFCGFEGVETDCLLGVFFYTSRILETTKTW